MNPSEHPATSEELAAFLQENAAGERRAIVPVGGGTWLDFGYPARPGVELHTGGLSRVLDYPARDMTITVEAGLPVQQLQETLRKERQQVPVDFPEVDRATVGGVIAANVFGPRRFGSGTLRDYVIGITAVDAGGRVFHAGGRVVKNVAGYDLCKLMVGSWGTLAVLTEVTLKVTPIPETHAWIWSCWKSLDQIDTAAARLLTSETRPVAMEVLNLTAAARIVEPLGQTWPAEPFVLAVLVAGSAADTEWQTQKLKEELAPHQPSTVDVATGSEAENLLNSLTSFGVTESRFSIRAHLLPSRTMEFIDRASQAGFLVQAHAGNGIVIAQAPEDLTSVEDASGKIAALRELAESQMGSLILTRCPAEWKTEIHVFGSGQSAWPLMKKLKTSLDPHNLLSPHRLFEPEG